MLPARCNKTLLHREVQRMITHLAEMGREKLRSAQPAAVAAGMAKRRQRGKQADTGGAL